MQKNSLGWIGLIEVSILRKAFGKTRIHRCTSGCYPEVWKIFGKYSLDLIFTKPLSTNYWRKHVNNYFQCSILIPLKTSENLKETLAHVLSCELCKFFQSTYFTDISRGCFCSLEELWRFLGIQLCFEKMCGVPLFKNHVQLFSW